MSFMNDENHNLSREYHSNIIINPRNHLDLNNLSAFSNFYKKTEKLASAVFLVANVMPDSEELKTRVKMLSVNLISNCVAIKDNVSESKKEFISRMETLSLEIVSLLNIAYVSGLISKMNALILEQEFNLFIKNLNELKEYCIQSNKISQDFFGENGEYTDNTLISLSSKNSIAKENKEIYRGEEKDKFSRKEYREKVIIDLIRTKGIVNIKDISRSIKGCSEKTIQRKLISLIDKGIIKKTGERRWSKYSLLKP